MTRPKFGISRGDFLLLLVAAVWGGSYLAVKQLGESGSTTALMTLRFIPAAIFLWLFWLKNRTPFTRPELVMSLGFGISQVIILNMEAVSVHLTSATNGGLIVSLAIILTPIAEGALSRNWLPPRFFLATVIAVLGVGLLIVGNGFVAPNLGDFIMLGAALLRTMHFALAGKFTQGKPVSALNLTVLQVTVSAVVMCFINPLETLQAAASYSAYDWWLILFLSLFCTALGFIGMSWGIKHTSASRTSLLLGTEPVFSTLIAVWFGGELMGPVGALGGALIVGATYWGQSIETKHRLASS
jgi:drug/metabolite transporter (DMT)-like permease